MPRSLLESLDPRPTTMSILQKTFNNDPATILADCELFLPSLVNLMVTDSGLSSGTVYDEHESSVQDNNSVFNSQRRRSKCFTSTTCTRNGGTNIVVTRIQCYSARVNDTSSAAKKATVDAV